MASRVSLLTRVPAMVSSFEQALMAEIGFEHLTTEDRVSLRRLWIDLLDA